MARVVVFGPKDSITGLVYAGKAFETFPWSVRARRQLVGSFNNAVSQYGTRLQVEPAAAEAIFQAGFSVSPYDVLTHIARAQYWLNHRDALKVRDSLKHLMQSAPNLPQTWLIAAWDAALSGGDPKPFAEKGLALPVTNQTVTEQLKRFLQ